MYRVEWQRAAALEAEELYFTEDATTRQQIIAAMQEIDAALAQIPMEVGESRNSPTDRLAFVRCLWVRYDVDTTQMKVNVNWVYFQRE